MNKKGMNKFEERIYERFTKKGYQVIYLSNIKEETFKWGELLEIELNNMEKRNITLVKTSKQLAKESEQAMKAIRELF